MRLQERVDGEYLEEALDTLSIGVMIYAAKRDKNSTITDFVWLYLNHFAVELSGKTKKELYTLSLLEVFPEHLSNGMFDIYSAVTNTGEAYQNEIVLSSPISAEDVWLEVLVSKIHDGVIVVFRPITERKQREKDFQEMAFRDALTNLHNRRYLSEYATTILSLARRQQFTISVLYIDLVNFKAVNDQFGHHTGDEVLRQIARRMAGLKRHPDILCRLGGDEFILLMPNTTSAQALQVAQRFIQNLTKPFKISGLDYHLQASFGIASSQGQTSLEELMHRADQAMYVAKQRKQSERFAVAVYDSADDTA